MASPADSLRQAVGRKSLLRAEEPSRESIERSELRFRGLRVAAALEGETQE